jgi:hypothetical protein
MIDAVRDSPCSVLAARQKPLIFRQFNSGIKFALESCHGGFDQVPLGRRQDRTPQPRGRPSVVAQFAAQISQWLRENPSVSGIEILRRAQLAGYRGGKSALYDRSDSG